VPFEKGPSGYYTATIISEPAPGGFKATVARVVRLLPRDGEVQYDGVVDHFAETKAKAELLATTVFKAWVKTKRSR
jgi:hypothetical protein